MDVLATMFKQNAAGREGYFNLYDIDSSNFKQYIFSTAIKITSKSPNNSFSKWIVYWEGSPFAVELSVITSVLETGFVKATVVNKEMRPVSEIGEYPGKSAKTFGYMVDGKFRNSEQTQDYITAKVLNSTKAPKDEVDQSKIDAIKNAWGIK